MSDSVSIPRTFRTRKSSACSIVSRNSAVLPMPGGPCSNNVPLRPPRAASRRALRRARSSLRPTMWWGVYGTALTASRASRGRQVAVGRGQGPPARRDLTPGGRPAYGSIQDSAPPSLPSTAGPIRNDRLLARTDQERAFELARRWGCVPGLAPQATSGTHPPARIDHPGVKSQSCLTQAVAKLWGGRQAAEFRGSRGVVVLSGGSVIMASCAGLLRLLGQPGLASGGQ